MQYTYTFTRNDDGTFSLDGHDERIASFVFEHGVRIHSFSIPWSVKSFTAVSDRALGRVKREIVMKESHPYLMVAKKNAEAVMVFPIGSIEITHTEPKVLRTERATMLYEESTITGATPSLPYTRVIGEINEDVYTTLLGKATGKLSGVLPGVIDMTNDTDFRDAVNEIARITEEGRSAKRIRESLSDDEVKLIVYRSSAYASHVSNDVLTKTERVRFFKPQMGDVEYSIYFPLSAEKGAQLGGAGILWNFWKLGNNQIELLEKKLIPVSDDRDFTLPGQAQIYYRSETREPEYLTSWMAKLNESWIEANRVDTDDGWKRFKKVLNDIAGNREEVSVF